MPMPPPKPSTEGVRDRQVAHEERQLVRAVKANGPQTADELAQLVGAPYWSAGRFDRALAFSLADGLLHRTPTGALAAT